MPTLLLWGEADRLIPVEQAPVWAELLPDAEIKRLPGVGHLVFEEHPEALDAIADFVAASSVAGTA
jgi:pimeloyl-ACP methyl ester carboxylesterase